MMWLLARRTGEPFRRERAEHSARLSEARQHDREVHDLGFLFWSTWRRWYDVEDDERLSAVVVEAGRTMALRSNPAGKYLRSFVAPESCFIDIMMNVGIVIHAANETGDDDLRRAATAHCLATRRCLVRGDGTTAHEGIFAPETEQFRPQATHQGWRDDSSSASRQGWAVSGVGTAYRLTGDGRFLATGQRCAAFFLDRTPPPGLPPNDWEEPDPSRPDESSSAAIAASGLFQVAALTEEPARAERYRTAARSVLDTLRKPEFLAAGTPGWEGILKHGSSHERRGLGVDESLMWGEYFFVEAPDKLLGRWRSRRVVVGGGAIAPSLARGAGSPDAEPRNPLKGAEPRVVRRTPGSSRL